MKEERNHNKVIAWGLIISWAVAVLLGSQDNNWYTIAGFGVLIFSIFATVALFSQSK
jgi:hypothetical protein